MNHLIDRLHGVFKCSVVAFAHMFHPREWARRDIYQWSRTLSVAGGTRALGTRTGKPVKISQQPVEGVKATACSLLTGSTQGSGGVRRQEGVRKARGTLWEICHCCSLILHSFSFLLFSSEMVWMPPKSAGDREEMSTTQCIDFNQSGEPRENRHGERTLGLKHYVIRHRVWRILREKIWQRPWGKGRGVFQGKTARRASASACAFVGEPGFVCRVRFICLFVLQKGVTVCTPTRPVLYIM